MYVVDNQPYNHSTSNHKCQPNVKIEVNIYMCWWKHHNEFSYNLWIKL